MERKRGKEEERERKEEREEPNLSILSFVMISK